MQKELAEKERLLDEATEAERALAGLPRDILHLKTLITFLDEQFAPMKKKSESLLEENTVTYDVLWLLFHEGSEVIYKDVHAGLKSAGRVSQSCLNHVLMSDHTRFVFCRYWDTAIIL